MSNSPGLNYRWLSIKIRATPSWPHKREELKSIPLGQLEAMILTLILLLGKWGDAEGPSLLRDHRLLEYLHPPLESAWRSEKQWALSDLQYFSFFPLGLGIKALWTGFCSYSVSLCKSPFRRPVCSSNFGIRKSDLNQTNSHLPSAFQSYHLLILCSNSLSLYKHHSPFLCFPLWSHLAIQQGPFKPHLSRETSGLCLSSPLSQSCPILSAYSAFF